MVQSEMCRQVTMYQHMTHTYRKLFHPTTDTATTDASTTTDDAAAANDARATDDKDNKWYKTKQMNYRDSFQKE